MTGVMGLILKTVFTENMLKKLLMILGDYLVKSSKNTLDDKIWNGVKNRLM